MFKPHNFPILVWTLQIQFHDRLLGAVHMWSTTVMQRDAARGKVRSAELVAKLHLFSRFFLFWRK
ncbi:hypothetical protein B9T62_29830 [Paenibacillus donghaensis]|uniref:Uncharacterized protein n=1 Tax=Paenibacillus donghaensis TaxID=414771 RepID=A0A2Z2KCY1_9BACL|nr:hypothetical protein B9T62_29830 [Paenibacillus donghaensis]